MRVKICLEIVVSCSTNWSLLCNKHCPEQANVFWHFKIACVKTQSWGLTYPLLCLSFIQDFREKNTDHMRPDIVALLKSSKNAFICSLMGIDPVATFRWAVLRAYFRAMVAFREAGRRHTHKKAGEETSVKSSMIVKCGSGFEVRGPNDVIEELNFITNTRS